MEWTKKTRNLSEAGEDAGPPSSLVSEETNLHGCTEGQERRGQPGSAAAAEDTAFEGSAPRVVVKERKRRTEGEIETGMVILMQGNGSNKAAMFQKNVVKLSQTLVERHPDIFAGPSRGMYKCSASGGVFVFQYALLLNDCTPENTALNCPRTLLKVQVNRSALAGIAGVDELNLERLQLCEQGKCYTHDTNPDSLVDSPKWAQVIMFTKHARAGPVLELSVQYYKIVILLVLLRSSNTIRSPTSLIDLFKRVSPL
ncbi:hypothetical protein F2P81_024044 [Scophthalmus maximus]|uniref:Uncharacterized protein n=1 Tax=Scophthalmus maximus TaxID=52904 RepID=A0A6A4RYA6_SCOMX|nr:hypothetical protein F2P81_024044 [Scophthalmus maximus]